MVRTILNLLKTVNMGKLGDGKLLLLRELRFVSYNKRTIYRRALTWVAESQTALIFDFQRKAEAVETSEKRNTWSEKEQCELQCNMFRCCVTDGLTLRGMLISISGKEITPSIFPPLRTTIVASIWRVIEQTELAYRAPFFWNYLWPKTKNNSPGQFRHMLKMEICKRKIPKLLIPCTATKSKFQSTIKTNSV